MMRTRPMRAMSRDDPYRPAARRTRSERRNAGHRLGHRARAAGDRELIAGCDERLWGVARPVAGDRDSPSGAVGGPVDDQRRAGWVPLLSRAQAFALPMQAIRPDEPAIGFRGAANGGPERSVALPGRQDDRVGDQGVTSDISAGSRVP